MNGNSLTSDASDFKELKVVGDMSLSYFTTG